MDNALSLPDKAIRDNWNLQPFTEIILDRITGLRRIRILAQRTQREKKKNFRQDDRNKRRDKQKAIVIFIGFTG